MHTYIHIYTHIYKHTYTYIYAYIYYYEYTHIYSKTSLTDHLYRLTTPLYRSLYLGHKQSTIAIV